MSLLSRIMQLERKLGTEDSPRRITIWFGSHYTENWIEWHGNNATFFVATPDGDDDPLEYLTPAQCGARRPGDSTIIIQSVPNGRESHLQLDRPPWKRTSDDELDGWAEQGVKAMAYEPARETRPVAELPFEDVGTEHNR